MKKVVIVHRGKYNYNNKVSIIFLMMWSLELQIATFRLLTASLHQAMTSTGCTSPYVSPRLALIGVFGLDSRTKIPTTIKKHNRRLVCQQAAEGTTSNWTSQETTSHWLEQ